MADKQPFHSDKLQAADAQLNNPYSAALSYPGSSFSSLSETVSRNPYGQILFPGISPTSTQNSNSNGSMIGVNAVHRYPLPTSINPILNSSLTQSTASATYQSVAANIKSDSLSANTDEPQIYNNPPDIDIKLDLSNMETDTNMQNNDNCDVKGEPSNHDNNEAAEDSEATLIDSDHEHQPLMEKDNITLTSVPPNASTLILQNVALKGKLANLRTSQLFTDLIFLLKGGQEVFAHKALVCEYSGFAMQKCMDNIFIPNERSTVHIDLTVIQELEINEQLLNTALDFIYGIKVTTTLSEVTVLKRLANALIMPDLIFSIGEALKKIKKENEQISIKKENVEYVNDNEENNDNDESYPLEDTEPQTQIENQKITNAPVGIMGTSGLSGKGNKRKRGRPQKVQVEKMNAVNTETKRPPGKKRGRKKKIKTEEKEPESNDLETNFETAPVNVKMLEAPSNVEDSYIEEDAGAEETDVVDDMDDDWNADASDNEEANYEEEPVSEEDPTDAAYRPKQGRKPPKTSGKSSKAAKGYKTSFVCKKCDNLKFKTRQEAFEHKKSVHSMFSCDLCMRVYETEASLKVHNMTHTGDNPYIIKTDTGKVLYQCDICQEEFTERDRFYTHMRAHRGKKALECQICGLRFEWFRNYTDHLTSHSSYKCFKCSLCESSFKRENAHRKHMKIYHKEYSALDHMYIQPKSKPDPGNFPCDMCEQLFEYEIDLLRHKRTHTGPFQCEKCDKQFVKKDKYNRHVLAHTKPYQCEFCGKGFGRKDHLQKHNRIHTGEKPHICDICGLNFMFPASLISHKRSKHQTDQPFMCHTCGKQFKAPYALKEHQRLHSNLKPFKCPHCDKSFAQRKYHYRHVNTHLKPFKCSVCTKGFSRFSHLKKHTGSHHKSVEGGNQSAVLSKAKRKAREVRTGKGSIQFQQQGSLQQQQIQQSFPPNEDLLKSAQGMPPEILMHSHPMLQSQILPDQHNSTYQLLVPANNHHTQDLNADRSNTRERLGVEDRGMRMVDTRSHMGDSRPHMGDSRPHMGDARSHMGDTRPHLGDSRTHIGETSSHLGETRAYIGDPRTHLGDTRSNTGEKSLDFNPNSNQMYTLPMDPDQQAYNSILNLTPGLSHLMHYKP
ncbi:unnamed protein product [Owenia fusiformis]|uniref:Uncharacterized protein n=1 Tax=Owenia fusiformis TaxID=6347 RepID=A0A8J1U1T2_OWEFU|nr:unnamed protein product [Owenia fusiformis]